MAKEALARELAKGVGLVEAQRIAAAEAQAARVMQGAWRASRSDSDVALLVSREAWMEAVTYFGPAPTLGTVPLKRADSDALFASLDQNGDGVLNLIELSKGLSDLVLNAVEFLPAGDIRIVRPPHCLFSLAVSFSPIFSPRFSA